MPHYSPGCRRLRLRRLRRHRVESSTPAVPRRGPTPQPVGPSRPHSQPYPWQAEARARAERRLLRDELRDEGRERLDHAAPAQSN